MATDKPIRPVGAMRDLGATPSVGAVNVDRASRPAREAMAIARNFYRQKIRARLKAERAKENQED